MVRGWPVPPRRDRRRETPPTIHHHHNAPTRMSGLGRLLGPRGGTRPTVLPPKSFRFGVVEGWGPRVYLNPTLAPLLALALPGCRSIGPVHPVSPLQKLNFSQSLPVQGEFLDHSLAHGGKDGQKEIGCQLLKCFYFHVPCPLDGMVGRESNQ